MRTIGDIIVGVFIGVCLTMAFQSQCVSWFGTNVVCKPFTLPAIAQPK